MGNSSPDGWFYLYFLLDFTAHGPQLDGEVLRDCGYDFAIN